MHDQPRRLTPAMEDHLRAIHDLGRERSPVHTTALSRHLDVAPASLTCMLKRLAVLGILPDMVLDVPDCPSVGPITVRLDSRDVTLERDLADAVFVVSAEYRSTRARREPSRLRGPARGLPRPAGPIGVGRVSRGAARG